MEQNENEVELFSSSIEYEINQVCSMLSDNNIPFVRKDYGSGSYMNLYMGQSIQEKVFVNQDNYDKARELIYIFIADNASNDDIEKTEKEIEVDDKKYKFIRRLFGFYIRNTIYNDINDYIFFYNLKLLLII